MESGQDQAIEALFAKTDHRFVEKIAPENIHYVYRFPGTGSYHLSAGGYGKGMEAVRKYVERRVTATVHRIAPHWKQDYVRLVEDILGVPCEQAGC